MRHINADKKYWSFGSEPFPAFRAELWFGRNKHDRAMIPVKDIVIGDDGLLQENAFRVIKTREKGTIMIVPGVDVTPRLLLFAGVADGFRGFSRLVTEHTTANILVHARASAACDGHTTAAAILDPGHQVVFETTGRYGHDIVVYALREGDLQQRTYTIAEWKAFHASIEDAEQL
jgi:hypothetical protein